MQEPLTLDQLIDDKEAVIAKAFRHPAVKIGPRTRIMPTLEQATKVMVSTVEFEAIEHCAKQARKRFTDLLEVHVMTYGERKDAEDEDAWDLELDEQVDNALFATQKYLSADWLGRNTVDCALHEDGQIEKLATSYGREIFKQLTHDQTPDEILSSAGILDVDVKNALDAHINQTPEEKNNMAQDQADDLQKVAMKIAKQVGKEYDILVISDEIDVASDDDDTLAAGALQRLGLDAQDALTLQMARMEHGSDQLPNVIFDLMDAKPGKAPRKPPVKGAQAKKAAAKKNAPADTGDTDDAAEAEGEGFNDSAVSSVVMEALNMAGAKDQEIAEKLGLSRPTYNNYRAGKQVFEPDVRQFGILRAEIVNRINGLAIALAALEHKQAWQID